MRYLGCLYSLIQSILIFDLRVRFLMLVNGRGVGKGRRMTRRVNSCLAIAFSFTLTQFLHLRERIKSSLQRKVLMLVWPCNGQVQRDRHNALNGIHKGIITVQGLVNVKDNVEKKDRGRDNTIWTDGNYLPEALMHPVRYSQRISPTVEPCMSFMLLEKGFPPVSNKIRTSNLSHFVPWRSQQC